MKKIIFILLAASLSFACKKNEKADVLLTENIVTDTTTAVSTVNSKTQVTQTPVVNPPTSASPTVITPPTTVSAPKIATQNTPTAPGMNPPHGQPNHRCDIPVGTPLSTPTKNTQVVQNNIVPQNNIQIQPSTPTSIQSAPVATAPGMNPPHGEPNHRCDIPVGAPLNSK